MLINLPGFVLVSTTDNTYQRECFTRYKRIRPDPRLDFEKRVFEGILKAPVTTHGTKRYLLASATAVAAVGAAGAVVYFLAARLGLLLLSAPSDVAVFWPAAGIAAGTLIVLGRRAGPVVAIGVVAGTVAANLMSDRSFLTSLLKGFCNAGEAVLAAWLLEGWFGWPFRFVDLRRVAGFLAVAGLATAISAIGGAATMSLLHTTAPYWDVWRAWFLSDGVGVVVVAPLVIGLAEVAREPPSRGEWIEGVGVLGLTALVSYYVMSHNHDSWLSFSPGAIVLPLLLWLTARCPRPFGIGGAFIASAAVILATTFGMGRFGDAFVPIMERVKGAQVATTMVTIYTLVLVALFAQRKEAEADLRESEGRLAKERAMLARLHEVGSSLWLKRDLRQALDDILAGAIELLGADMGTIRIWDSTRGVLKIEAHRGFKQECLDLFRQIPALGKSPCETALRSGERMVIADVEADALFTPFRSLARAAGYRAMQSTPIINSEGMPLGMLATHFHSVHKSDEQDLRLLDLYVRQAADIIERHRAEDTLRESEERLRLAQLRTGIGIWDWNLRTDKLTCTPELEAIFGLELGSVKTYADYRARVHPDDIEAIQAGRNAAVRRRETFQLEYRIIRPDGQVRWILAVGGAIYDEATSEPTRILGNNVDITERKLAELALAERNAQLALAGQAALVGSYAYEPDLERMKVSEGYCAMHGLPEGTTETTRSQWRVRVHPDDLERLEDHRARTFADKRDVLNLEYRIVRAGGEVRWIESRSIVFYDSDGQPHRVIGINIDVTERKQTEARLSDALAAGQVVAFDWDAATGRSQRSDNADRIMGFVEGGRFLRQVHAIDRGTFKTHLRGLSPDNPSYSFVFRFIRRDGGQVWLQESARGEFDDAGKLLRIKGLTRDITNHKRAELALAERNAQLALAGRAVLVGSYTYDVNKGTMQVSEGYAAIHGLPEGTTEASYSEWRARVHPEDLGQAEWLRDQAFADRRKEDNAEYRIVLPTGEDRWIERRGSISYGEDGRPERVVGVNIDVTERKRAEQILVERKTQLEVANNIAQVGSYTYNYATRKAWLGPGSASIYGLHENSVEMSSDEWRQYVHPDDLGQLIAEACQALANRQRELVCVFRILRHGEVRWIETRNRYFYDKAGRATQAIGASIDVTERRRAEDYKGRLIAELDHRVKNVLAIVSAVAGQTLETSSSMSHFVAALDGRIQSMAATHELLSTRQWRGVSMVELVRREFAAYAGGNNTKIDGPDVMLSAEAGQAMGMVIHELATNAAKYGALSDQSGRVSVRWYRNLNGSAQLILVWQETGGPRVEAPKKTGYGTGVIRDLIPYEFGGTVDLAFAHDGVRCRVEIPFDRISSDSRDASGSERLHHSGRSSLDLPN